MTDRIDEQISALVDDEIGDAELKVVIEKLGGSDDLAERWQRYNLISDALHNNLPEAIAPDLTGRVRQALENEPVVLAPRRWRVPQMTAPLLRQVGGMAAAASVAVAVVMVLSLQQDPVRDSGIPSQLADQQESAPVVPSVAEPTVAAIQQPAIQPRQPAVAIPRAVLVSDMEPSRPMMVTPREIDSRFESYLINHSEYAVSGGMLPYTRLVGHAVTTEQRSMRGE